MPDRELDDICFACKVGLHNECDLSFTDMLDDDEECCCHGQFSLQLYTELDAELDKIAAENGGIKAPGEIGDNTSTGRKRAAQIAPIFEGMICEWAGLKFAGGGPAPIVGCAGTRLTANREVTAEQTLEGIQRGDLHHGPNKSTLDNRPGVNLHRICSTCHNRAHALMNKFYGKRPAADTEYLPLVPYWDHDPNTVATDEERALIEAWWHQPAASRGEYPFAPDVPARLPRGAEGATGGEVDP